MFELPPFDPKTLAAGVLEPVAPGLRRLVAPNAGPFTFTGTCSYIVGEGHVAIIDPGPDDPAHLARLLAAVAAESVDAILVTHTHVDHSPGALRLAAATGAPVYGAGPHRPARPPLPGETQGLDAAADWAFLPARRLQDGEILSGPGWSLKVVATPGHCANHLAFALRESELLLSGDHVMAWSTTVVAPPDGAMADYMRSLQKLVGRPERRYFPGHGGPVDDPQPFLRAMIQHRRMREAAIRRRVEAGDATVEAIAARVYEGIAPALVHAARLNTLAHLEDLVEQGVVTTGGQPGLAGHYELA